MKSEISDEVTESIELVVLGLGYINIKKLTDWRVVCRGVEIRLIDLGVMGSNRYSD